MKQQGFTLIELLVVISIIATLIALGVPNYLGARQRALDGRRKTEMAELKNALRLYYNDNSAYPASLSACNGSVDFASGATCDNVYMKKYPTGLGSTITYTQAASGDDFCLATTLENASDGDSAVSITRCATACSTNCTTAGMYCVCAD